MTKGERIERADRHIKWQRSGWMTDSEYDEFKSKTKILENPDFCCDEYHWEEATFGAFKDIMVPMFTGKQDFYELPRCLKCHNIRSGWYSQYHKIENKHKEMSMIRRGI